MIAFVLACWNIVVDSSLWMLFGFFMAGLLRAFVPADFVARHLGTGRAGSVFKAAVFGVPLPLCSCGVIPAAAGLRRQGASKGATASFLIATPETGVDSMAVTWALLDPVMTVLRPVAAFVTAMVTGLVIDATDREEPSAVVPPVQLIPQPAPLHPLGETAPACASGCCSCGAGDRAVPETPWQRFVSGQRFAFDDLLADIAPWFALGVLVAGLIAVFLPDDLGAMLPGGGLTSMLAMLVVALPMYVCATASTPIAAALAMKGFSPGALLVFLLAGPATNAATISTVAKMLGRRSAAIYVGSIVAMTLVCALLADVLYAGLGLQVHAWLENTGGEEHGMVSVLAAVIMLGLLVKYGGAVLVRRFRG